MNTPQRDNGGNTSLDRRQTARRMWLKLHMFIGLFVGAIFVILGLTGSTLVFRHTLDGWLNPSLFKVQSPGAPASLDGIRAAVQSALPAGAQLLQFEFPSARDRVIRVLYRSAAVDGGSQMEIMIDPTTGSILGQRERDRHLMGFLYHFHREILAGAKGETVIGTVGILLIISLTTGLYLWWPGRRGIRTSLAPRVQASPLQRAYARHKLTGVLGCVPIFLIASSGVFMEFEGVGKALVHRLSSLSPDPSVVADAKSGLPLVSLDEVMSTAQQRFPSSGPLYLELPQGPSAVYVVGIRQHGEVSLINGATAVWIDPYGGRVLAARDWKQFSAGQTFLSWILPLHD